MKGGGKYQRSGGIVAAWRNSDISVAKNNQRRRRGGIMA